ncbi:hypothetical protein FRC01_002188 [Tulasnella sp. 417]|nr:hypothetical protein FRC01_002188 [Tulasnella sp. 417]
MAEQYEPQTNKSTSSLPFKTVFESEGSPYDFLDYAHNDWITRAVFVYRKSSAVVSPMELSTLVSLGFLNPYHILDSNGIGIVPEGVQPSPAIETPKPKLRVFKFQLGDKTYYTHIEAIPEELKQSIEQEPVREDQDLRHVSSGNTPTLGPYSFQVFHSGRQTTRASTVGRPASRVTSWGSASRRTAATEQSSERYRSVPSVEHTAHEERLKRKQFMQAEVEGDGDQSGSEEEEPTNQTADEGESENGDRRRANFIRRRVD